MTTSLDEYGSPVQVGAVVVRTPGLRGNVDVVSARTAGTRGAVATVQTQTIDRVLAADSDAARNRLKRRIAVPLTDLQPVASATGTRGERATPRAIVQVPPPPPGSVQLALMEDEWGVLTWHFPVRPKGRRGAVTREGGLDTFDIPIPETPPKPRRRETRSILTSLGDRVVHFLVFKVADEVVGYAAGKLAAHWEGKHRWTRQRDVTKDDFGRSSDVGPDWNRAANGRALLFVHGTLTSVHTELGRANSTFIGKLASRYPGGFIGFDHFTLSQTPEQNARWFAQQIPNGANLDVDILCVSRGGLVARMLAEQAANLPLRSRGLKVGRIVFLAVPNDGTALAEPGNWTTFIDSYTNILTLIPSAPTEILEGVIAVAKILARGFLTGLKGLEAMRPKGDFLAELNRGVGVDSRYRGVASNFEPASNDGFGKYARDWLIDGVFEKKDNDLIVPTKGVFGPKASPVVGRGDSARLVFAPTDHIDHSGYLCDQRVRDRVLTWLAG